MQKVMIIGANGKVGRIITRKMKESGDFIPIALFRNESQKSYFKEIHVEYRVLSLEEDLNRLADIMEGMDAIVFTAGSGGSSGYDKTLAVDLDGAVKSMEAAMNAKVSRFVMISALNAGNREKWKNSKIKPYYIAKHYADRFLQMTDLEYTILRPGRLLDETGTGKITVKDPGSSRGVSREDVASLVLETLRSDNTIGKTIEFNEGDKPINEVGTLI